MIRHVVMWRVRGDTASEREAGSATVKAAFEKLRGQIPSMQRLEIGIDVYDGENACDVVLIADFDSVAALESYAAHPRHLSVRDELAGLRISRHCVDFEVQHE